MKLIRTTNTDKDFTSLTAQLDAELRDRYKVRQAIYDQHNKLDPIDTALIGFVGSEPVACGCFRHFDDRTVEIKRMFVNQSRRRRGLSTKVLSSLEDWAVELGYSRAVLETGLAQPEAIGLYKKCGYRTIDNYGPYVGMDESVCLAKELGEGI